jgi:hypothetical protein
MDLPDVHKPYVVVSITHPFSLRLQDFNSVYFLKEISDLQALP